jgi:hypothetical protein
MENKSRTMRLLNWFERGNNYAPFDNDLVLRSSIAELPIREMAPREIPESQHSVMRTFAKSLSEISLTKYGT